MSLELQGSNGDRSPWVAVVGILGAVGLCIGGLVSGTAALVAIAAICAKTDAATLIDKLKGK
jgi:hypothetical protein